MGGEGWGGRKSILFNLACCGFIVLTCTIAQVCSQLHSKEWGFLLSSCNKILSLAQKLREWVGWNIQFPWIVPWNVGKRGSCNPLTVAVFSSPSWWVTLTWRDEKDEFPLPANVVGGRRKGFNAFRKWLLYKTKGSERDLVKAFKKWNKYICNVVNK